MASRAVTRGRKYILQQLTVPVWSFSIISSSGHGKFGCDVETRRLGHVSKQKSVDTEPRRERKMGFLAREEFSGFLFTGFLRGPRTEISILGSHYGRSEALLPFGTRGLSQYVRTASTAAAKQPEIGSREELDEDQKQKMNKEASPEECDQAVEGLSTTKAKAKAKQLQEAQKMGQSIFYKFWAKILGIGPALRAVASLSREDWAIKIRHWKDEFVSTLQLYWLGSKLLWADKDFIMIIAEAC